MFSPNGEKTGREPQWKKSIETQKDDATLRKIIDKNFKKNFSMQRKPRPDLIDNFRWVITRFRRMKKVTQEQLARDISEPLAAVQMAEQGVLPERDYILVKKIENYLGIVLIKEEKTKEQGENKIMEIKTLTFEPNSSKNLTIADLRRIREEKSSMLGQFREEKNFPEFEVDFEEEPEEISEDEKTERDEENER